MKIDIDIIPQKLKIKVNGHAYEAWVVSNLKIAENAFIVEERPSEILLLLDMETQRVQFCMNIEHAREFYLKCKKKS